MILTARPFRLTDQGGRGFEMLDEMTLWTNDMLEDARHIYARAGFELVEDDRHDSFGQDLVGQNWWRRL